MHAASTRIGLTVMDNVGLRDLREARPCLARRADGARYALQLGIKSLAISGTPSPLPAEVRAVNITGWNDGKGQTASEVLRAFRSGAEQLRLRIACVQDGIKGAENG